jgi:hypothetical protein
VFFASEKCLNLLRKMPRPPASIIFTPEYVPSLALVGNFRP